MNGMDQVLSTPPRFFELCYEQGMCIPWNLHASLYKSKTTIFRGTKDEARLECIQLEMTLKLRCLMVIALMLRARLESNRCRRGQPDTSGDEAKDAETARNQGYISHGQDFQGAKRIPTCSEQPRKACPHVVLSYMVLFPTVRVPVQDVVP